MSVYCECCQVEVSATSRSLVQRSPTDCGASLCVIWKPREWGGHGPLGRGGGCSTKNKQKTKVNQIKLRDLRETKTKRVYLLCWKFTVLIEGFGRTEQGTRKTGNRIRRQQGRWGGRGVTQDERDTVTLPMYVHAVIEAPFCHAIIQHVKHLVTFQRTFVYKHVLFM